MRPHAGSGGCTPRPRNDSAASDRIAKARLSDVWTMIGATTLGRMCVLRILPSVAPSDRAAVTNTWFLIPNTEPRVMRAKIGV